MAQDVKLAFSHVTDRMLAHFLRREPRYEGTRLYL